MKKLLVLFVLFISAAAKGQYVMNESLVEILEETTTIFFVNTENEDSLILFQEMLDSVWTFTNIIAVPISERQAYMDDEVAEYSFFEFWGALIETLHTRNVYTSLDLNIYTEKREKIAGFNIYTTSKFKWTIVRANHYGTLDNFDLYAWESDYLNWDLGFIKNYLQVMDLYLKTQNTHYTIDSTQTAGLIRDTLYIPDYILRKFSMSSPREKKPHKPDEFLKWYKLPYKVLSSKSLSYKILTSDVPFYYLEYVLHGENNNLAIRNSKTGIPVYEYNFDGKLKSKRFKKMYNDIINASGG